MANIAVTRREFDSLAEDVQKHTEWIDGNGKEGAKQTLTRYDERWAAMEKRIGVLEEKIDSMTKAAWGLVVTIGAGVLIWFMTDVMPRIFGG